MDWPLALKLYTYQTVIFAFLFAFGACLGSLVNVLVYRLPLGMGVVTPPSRCTSCGTRLTWRENFPVFGWILLGGKCRFCRSPVSREYPIVEAAVGFLFVVLYAYLFAEPSIYPGRWLDAVRPEWAWGRFPHVWPIFIVWLLLATCLVAILLVDAKTFMIPLPLVWWPAVFGLVGHVGYALYCQLTVGHPPFGNMGWDWAIATPKPHHWPVIGASLGGMVGIGLSSLLLAKGLITRSFADYEEWEAKHVATGQGQASVASADESPQTPDSKGLASQSGASSAPESSSQTQADLWVQYPHARREMIREVLFLAPAIGLALLGAAMATKFAGPWKVFSQTGESMPAFGAPLWLVVLSGVCLGYLIGGGLVWLVRILGTLAFGKEAMGLGDVHMMAAVGACLGWIDSTLAFFAAAFVGLIWNIGQVFRDSKKPLPYGPYLAVATVLVMLSKHWIELAMTLLVKADQPISLP
jgi:leader peptidase (prepilin peptidase) / N-methyltransferase